MSETNPSFEDKRHALCWCCGGWENASREDIQARWGQLPAARAKSYLHRFAKLRDGSDEEKKQAESFIQSLPTLPQAKQSKTPIKPKATKPIQPPKKAAQTQAEPGKAADNKGSSST